MDPYRSMLFVPAHKEGWARKGAAANADAVILDLEDAVPPDQKAAARARLPEAIAEAREVKPNIGIVVRANHWSSPEAPADYEAIVRCGADAAMVPKVDDVHELVRLDAVLEHIERMAGGAKPLELIATLETARGVANRDAIANGPRVRGMLGASAKGADIARSIGFEWTAEGLETLFLRSGVVIASRAAVSCHPIVGMWQDIKDLEGFEKYSAAQRGLGFRGQVVIHPSHVEITNRAFSPSATQVAYYQGMVDAYEKAVAGGHGAVIYDGEHIDLAHVENAREVVAFAAGVAQRS